MKTSAARKAFALLLLCLAVASGPPAAAQPDGSAEAHVTWTAHAAPAAPGDTTRLTLRAQIADGWKMYAMDSPPPTRGAAPQIDALPAGLSLPANGSAVFMQSEPKRALDEAFEKEVRYFEGEATLHAEVAVSDQAAPGQRDVGGTVTFMVCTAEKCLPPARRRFAATLDVHAP